MEQTEFRIIPPKGYEVDKEHSTFECIKFKKINILPKTWEEFSGTHGVHSNEAYVDANSNIELCTHLTRLTESDRNLLPSVKYAEAIRALCQLIQLRDCYNNGWEPNWSNDECKYIIVPNKHCIAKLSNFNMNRVLAFKSEEVRDKFLENFEDLINTAKPLL